MTRLLPALVVGFAALVIVPQWWRRTTRWPGGLLVIGLLRSPGAVAACLTVPWLVSALRMSVRKAAATRVPQSIEQLGDLGAHGFLVVGATSATIAAAGWRPLGFGPVVVILTAAHFHYAGFAFGMIASRTRRDRPTVAALIAIGGWILGVPLVALGIAVDARLEPFGSVLVAIAGVALGTELIRAGGRHHSARLRIAGMSIIGAMVLAAGYGLAPPLGFHWLDITAMERMHGMLNAFGFALCATSGWRRVDTGDGEATVRCAFV